MGGGLRSPHTLQLQDLGETERGLPYLVFPWLDGRPLGDALALHPEVARDVALQVIESLEEAHSSGVIHGNLKPSNVLAIPRRGWGFHICVSDYALTRRYGAHAEDDVSDADGEALGSPRYMAPEQLMSRPVGPVTDLYSLGLILAEALTGERLYPEGMSPLAVANRAASAAPVPLSEGVRTGALGAVLAVAVQKDPTRRYQSCSAMRRALLGG